MFSCVLGCVTLFLILLWFYRQEVSSQIELGKFDVFYILVLLAAALTFFAICSFDLNVVQNVNIISYIPVTIDMFVLEFFTSLILMSEFKQQIGMKPNSRMQSIGVLIVFGFTLMVDVVVIIFTFPYTQRLDLLPFTVLFICHTFLSAILMYVLIKKVLLLLSESTNDTLYKEEVTMEI